MMHDMGTQMLGYPEHAVTEYTINEAKQRNKIEKVLHFTLIIHITDEKPMREIYVKDDL